MIYYEGLAHKIMEAEKSHNLSSASQKPRGASDFTQYKTKGIRIGELSM